MTSTAPTESVDDPVVLDVVLTLPPALRSLAITASVHLAARMEAAGEGVWFRLGSDHVGGSDGPCEPHVSLFMMVVNRREIDDVAAALSGVAPGLARVQARASAYRHNHEGAPELFYERSTAWRELQRAVVATVEPLRRGRLREFGPAGERLADVVDHPHPVDAARVRQLLTYGYDDVCDDLDDRFNPHVTLTWPKAEDFRVDMSVLPSLREFDATLRDLALYGMGPHGTCTVPFGVWSLGRSTTDGSVRHDG